MGKISKHQEQGKHSLGYDVFFKGKKEEIVDQDYVSEIYDYQETFQYDPGSPIYDEAYNNVEFERRRKVTRRVYEVIVEKTDINLKSSRRKPSRVAFNEYFLLIKNELKEDNFTNVEIFNELSVYFSDNLMSIFKLLESQWRNLIIKELKEHIGGISEESKSISIRNLTIGAEIEFHNFDEVEDVDKLITGIILEYDKELEIFKVDSFENIYLIKIEDVVKIMNNKKFKYNLNKLDNIDFF